MSRVVRIALLVLVATAAVVAYEHRPRPPVSHPISEAPARDSVSAPPTVVPGPPASGTAVAPPAHGAIGFRSHALLVEHFRKHGQEFGAADAEHYLKLAQALRDRLAGGELLEARRADGVITRFDRATGAFIAFDPDGTIRTFFRPRDGLAYFERQKNRAPRTSR